MPAWTSYYRSMTADRETAKGCRLETLTWVEAEQWFSRDPVVVIPLGAAAKEHGPHLPLNNDAIIAEWLGDEIRKVLPVVVAPLVNASYYPAFVEYPGSISLSADTARAVIVDTCRSLAAHGTSRFYVLNTGVSTEGPLTRAQRTLSGFRFDYLRLGEAMQRVPDGVLEQGWGTHADEHETSLMLHIAPAMVAMDKAVDDGSEGEGRLSRSRGDGIYSPSGVYGQATLAAADKGRLIARALLEQALADIEILDHSLVRA